MDFEQRARQAADDLRSTPVPTPAVVGVLRRGRRRSSVRAAGLTIVAVTVLVLGGVLLVRVTAPPDQGTAATTSGPLAGRWTIDVPTATAASAQVPPGRWTITVVPGSITLDPVGRPSDRIVERISSVTRSGTVQMLGEDQSVAFNFVCDTPATYTWTTTSAGIRLRVGSPEDPCLARRLVLTLPWTRTGPG